MWTLINLLLIMFRRNLGHRSSGGKKKEITKHFFYYRSKLERSWIHKSFSLQIESDHVSEGLSEWAEDGGEKKFAAHHNHDEMPEPVIEPVVISVERRPESMAWHYGHRLLFCITLFDSFFVVLETIATSKFIMRLMDASWKMYVDL